MSHLELDWQNPGARQFGTVLLRAAKTAIPHRFLREVAAAIPNATFVPLQGSSHFPWHGDVDSVIRVCRQALTPHQRSRSVADKPDPGLPLRRERDILAHVARGLSDREIAEDLALSPQTVHRHVANVSRKFGCSSRIAAVVDATRLELLSITGFGHQQRMAGLSDAILPPQS